MTLYSMQDDRVVALTASEELAHTATKPGEFAKHYANKHGLARRFAPVAAWFVNLDQVTRVEIVELRGSGLECCPPVAYGVTTTGTLLPSHYLFPVARHCKPRLATLRDELGTFQQWVAPLRSNCRSPWD